MNIRNLVIASLALLANQNLSAHEITWVGLQGAEPGYIASGDEKGMGYLEFWTREVRKALVNEGYKLNYTYFTQSRLEREFAITDKPMCFYPFVWKNPAKVFATKPDRIYSIPLLLGGEEPQKIIFRKEDREKFTRYLTKDGDVDVKALVGDASLKTVLVKDQDYGDFSKLVAGKTNVTYIVASENKQLIKMLDGKRMDYTLAEQISASDFKEIEGGEARFDTLNFPSLGIKSIEDPKLTYSSVICSVTPVTIAAMPVINEMIRSVRGLAIVEEKRIYKATSEGRSWARSQSFNTLESRFASDLGNGATDTWFSLQARHFPGLIMLPEKELETQKQIEVSPPRAAPRWLLIQPKPGTYYILNEADYFTIENGRLPGVQWTFDHQFLARQKIFDALDREELALLVNPTSPIDANKELAHLSLNKLKDPHKLVVFASGVSAPEIRTVLGVLKAKSLREFTLIDAGTDTTKLVVETLPAHLTALNLTNSSTRDAKIADAVLKMQSLRSLDLTRAQVPKADFRRILLNLPPTLETLAIGWHVKQWSVKLAEEFGRSDHRQLRQLRLNNSVLDDRHLEPILSSVGDKLELLDLYANFGTSRSLLVLFAKDLPRLTSLDCSTWSIASKKGTILKFPTSLTSLKLNGSRISETTFRHMDLPPQLTDLDLGRNSITDTSVEIIAKHLASAVKSLNLNENSITDQGVATLARRRIRNIDMLDLSANRITESGITALAESKIKIRTLLLSQNRLNNKAARLIADTFGPDLSEIDLSANRINEVGINHILERAPQLKRLTVRSMVSLDFATLAKKIPKTLQELDVAFNGATSREISQLAPALPQSLRALMVDDDCMVQRAASLEGVALNLVAGGGCAASGYSPYLQIVSLDLAIMKNAIAAHDLPPRVLLMMTNTTNDSWARGVPAGIQHLFVQDAKLTRGSIKALADLRLKNLRSFEVHGTDPDRALEILAEHGPSTLEHFTPVISGMNEATQKALATLFTRSDVYMTLISNSHVTQDWLDTARGMQSLTIVGGTIPSGALAKFTALDLERMTVIRLPSVTVSLPELAALLRKLPPRLRLLDLASTGMKPEDVDMMIAALPKDGVDRLNVRGNDIGEAGFAKFRAYKARIEAETGLSVTLIE